MSRSPLPSPALWDGPTFPQGKERRLAHQDPRSRAPLRQRITGVEQRTYFQGQAPATNAAVEVFAQRLQVGDLLIEALSPTSGQALPISLRGCAAVRQPFKRFLDFLQC